MTPDDRSTVDQALDLLVYAPIGMALTARDELPRLIQRGRLEAQGRVALARMVGQFAVLQGQKEAEKLVDGLVRRFAGDTEGPPAESTSRTEPAPPPGRRDPAVTAEGLAIPGYDSLSASQVVSRLAGLDAADLDAVRAYEESTRGRRTILNRISQLQSEL